MDNYNKQLEDNLLEMVKQKESADRRLLALEIFIGVLVSVILITLVMLAFLVPMADWLRAVLIVMGVVSFAIGMVMLSFATNDWVLLGSALFLGFGVGTIQSCGLAMAVRATADARLSLANSTFYILIDTGVGVGPMILGLMVPLMGYRAMFQCMAVVALVGLAIFLVITRGRNERQAL